MNFFPLWGQAYSRSLAIFYVIVNCALKFINNFEYNIEDISMVDFLLVYIAVTLTAINIKMCGK